MTVSSVWTPAMPMAGPPELSNYYFECRGFAAETLPIEFFHLLLHAPRRHTCRFCPEGILPCPYDFMQQLHISVSTKSLHADVGIYPASVI